MIYVGIDVAKEKNDCHIITSEGEILVDLLTFLNTKEGFDLLYETVKNCCKGNFKKVKVGLEATGHYSSNLLSYLAKLNWEVVVFNPLSVNRSRKALSLRRTKTDKNDSRYIAEMLITDRSSAYQEKEYHISALKSITRARYRLVKEIQPLKNRYRKSIHLLFLEIDKLFCGLYLDTVLNLLRELPSAKDIASCNITRLTNLLSSYSHGKFKRAKAEELKLSAKNTVAAYNYGDALELRFTAERILFLEAQKARYDEEIDAIMSELNSPITTIPGIGNIVGATILAEVGDITAFQTSAKLLAFAGAEPSTYQSGKFTATHTPMVKHGSKYLRNALYLATTMAQIHSPSFKAYIERKRAQGKHYYVAISHGMKKMTRVIFSILTSNTPFVEVI